MGFFDFFRRLIGWWSSATDTPPAPGTEILRLSARVSSSRTPSARVSPSRRLSARVRP